MTSITHSTGVIVPTIVDGYRASSTVNTIVHDIINRDSPDVTLRKPGLRRGSLRCVFDLEADAVAAFAVFRTPQVLALTDPDRTTIGMSFVVGPEGEEVKIDLDDETRDAWVVTVPFVEVTP